MGSVEEVDKETQEFMNGSEVPGPMKSEAEIDDSIEKFFSDLIKPSKKS
jgi:hypothetical protein